MQAGIVVLTRLGMNEGVANALQTMTFYLLLVCVGFVALELLNVPLTVFAFMGGAVAIGVAFGSQNILNNFISGLIILAERPIRVGDLIEIDSLKPLEVNLRRVGSEKASFPRIRDAA